ncbi:unnamed protein product [Prunus armeniaca]
MQINYDPSWQDPIIDYLVNANLLREKFETRNIKQKATRYYMKDNKLVRISYFGPHLTCIKYQKLSKCYAKSIMANVEIVLGAGY